MLFLIAAVGFATGMLAEFMLFRHGWLSALPFSLVILLAAYLGYTQGGFDGFEALTLMLAYSASSMADPLIKKGHPASTNA